MSNHVDRLNSRDVGLTVMDLLQDSGDCPALPLPSCRLIRGPQLGGLSYEELGRPRTIVNLRACPDDLMETVDWKTGGPWPDEIRSSLKLVHCGAANDIEKYDTTNTDVRDWLVKFVALFQEPLCWPVLVHCRAGRDRTGVAIAILLLLLDVPEDIVIKEFLLSNGAAERLSNFRTSLAGIAKAGGVRRYLSKDVDVDAVRRNLHGQLSASDEAALLRRECGLLFGMARTSCTRSCVSVACQRIVQVEQRITHLLSDREPALLAASGWALVQLERFKEARALLKEGLRTAESVTCGPGRASAGAVKMMRKELTALEELESCASFSQGADTDNVDLLCAESLLSWASSQKFVNQHERIPVSKITPELFLGSRFGILDGSTLLLDSLRDKVLALSGRHLSAIVNVAALEPKATYDLPAGISYYPISVKDHEDALLLPLLDDAVDFIHSHVSTHGACFVHCMGGYSRSASVVIAYLIKYRGLSCADAYMVTGKGRPIIKPNIGFARQLLEYEGRHFSKRR